VVRCFTNTDVIHVMSGDQDPVRDMEVVEMELALADLQSIDKRLAAGGGGKAARTAEGQATMALLRRAAEVLNAGKPARVLDGAIDARDAHLWRGLQLLTQKPVLYLCNVDEASAAAGRNAHVDAVRAHLSRDLPSGTQPFLAVVCAQLEAEAALLSDADRQAFLAEYGMRQSGLEGLLSEAARLLRLNVFYTSGPAESRAWPIPQGSTAVEAAGTIHSDFASTFIKAEITPWQAYVAAGGEAGSKAANVTRVEGKEYVMADGDVAVFRVSGGRG